MKVKEYLTPRSNCFQERDYIWNNFVDRFEPDQVITVIPEQGYTVADAGRIKEKLDIRYIERKTDQWKTEDFFRFREGVFRHFAAKSTDCYESPDLIVLDIENSPLDFEDIRERMEAFDHNYLIHTTFSHGPARKCYRIIIPVAEAIYDEDFYYAESLKLARNLFPGCTFGLWSFKWAYRFNFPSVPVDGLDFYKVAYQTEKKFYEAFPNPNITYDPVPDYVETVSHRGTRARRFYEAAVWWRLRDNICSIRFEEYLKNPLIAGTDRRSNEIFFICFWALQRRKVRNPHMTGIDFYRWVTERKGNMTV